MLDIKMGEKWIIFLIFARFMIDVCGNIITFDQLKKRYGISYRKKK